MNTMTTKKLNVNYSFMLINADSRDYLFRSSIGNMIKIGMPQCHGYRADLSVIHRLIINDADRCHQ